MSTALLLTMLPLTSAMSATTWLTSGNLRLGLLPCSMDDAMLPGERRDLFFFEDRFERCLSNAHATHGCVGALYLTEDGDPVQFSSLLEIESFRSDSLGCFARVKCVGRVRLGDVRGTLEEYQEGSVEMYADEDTEYDDASYDESLSGTVARLRELHAETAKQRRQLYSLLAYDDFGGKSGGRPPDADVTDDGFIHVSPERRDAPFGVFNGGEDEDEEVRFETEDGELLLIVEGDVDDPDGEVEYVFVGLPFEQPHGFGTSFFNCRDHAELDDEENGAELDELLATRRAVLTSGDDNTLLNAVGGPWLVKSEAAANRQLLSFAAAASLGPAERAEALLIRDAGERIEYALEATFAQQSQLTSLLKMAESEVGRRRDY